MRSYSGRELAKIVKGIKPQFQKLKEHKAG
jgi:hypothetical protein